MKLYYFIGHLSPTPAGMLPMQMSGYVYLAADVRRELYQLASDLVCGKLLPALETDWYVSTPLAERRRIIKAMEACADRHREMAVKIKELTEE